MNPDNKTFLEKNEYTWITLRDAGYMMGLDGNTRSEMVRVMSEEFRHGYTTDLWCPPCVADMLTALYFEFNKWREALAKRAEAVLVEMEAEPAVIPTCSVDHAAGAEVTVITAVQNGEIIDVIEEPVIEDDEPAKTDAAEDFAPEPIIVKAAFPSNNQQRRRRHR